VCCGHSQILLMMVTRQSLVYVGQFSTYSSLDSSWTQQQAWAACMCSVNALAHPQGTTGHVAEKLITLSLCACVVQRKKTLLVEYKQLRKANTFIDKRFGGKETATAAAAAAAAAAWCSLASDLRPNSTGLSIRKISTAVLQQCMTIV
jgi:hypothetical protein